MQMDRTDKISIAVPHSALGALHGKRLDSILQRL